ncbi:M16 family metallopeptidase [Alkalinema pantanalense CENA528]|uniref:M16 family metallopeptidase n=1 Tax=Alkalinema pantanalense TaxID=1620705 RepID=UPI003D6F4803
MTSILVRTPQVTPLNVPTIHRLANGMTVIAEQMPVDAVTLNLWLNVGSIVESDDINGMAHFLEHMIFKGTEQLASGEFEYRIEERGAVTNAATSHDYTHYYITTAPQDFADLAPLQLDVLLNAAIPAEGFERERQVVLEEIRRSDDNARRRTYQHMLDLGFSTLPYRRPVLGPTSVIEQLTSRQMLDFHRHWYQPQQMTAVAVGNLPVEELIHTVERSCEQWTGGTHRSTGSSIGQRSLPERPTFAGEQPFQQIIRQEFVDPTLQQARLMVIWRVPGVVDLEETYALDVLSNILGHGRTARLVQDLREQRGLVSGIGATNITYQHQGLFCVTAQLPVEYVETVEAAMIDHVQRLQTELIPAAELEKVCIQVANQFVFGNETPSDRTNLYGYYYAMTGSLDPVYTYADRVRSLTPQALQAAAQKYLTPNAYGVVVVKPSA